MISYPSTFVESFTVNVSSPSACAVTFAAGDDNASGDMEPVTVASGASYTLPESGFTAPAGKAFAGWLVGEDTTPTAAGENITVNSNVTLTAAWSNAENAVRVVGASVTLEGQIGLNFDLRIPEAILNGDGNRVELTFKGNTSFITLAGKTPLEAGTYVYRFSYRMAAKEIAEKVTMRVVDGDGNPITLIYDGSGNPVAENTVRYAVTDYCEKARQYGEADVVALTDALQNYGAYAWTFFTPDDIAQPEVTEGSSISGVTVDSVRDYAAAVNGSVSGLTLAGLFLDLESETNLRLYLTAESGFDISSLTVKCGQDTLTPSRYDQGWDVKITNIPAKDLDKNYTVVITKGDETVSVSFCALSYVYSVLAYPGSDTNYGALSNTVKALYVYNQAANGYFE